jgi:hypothetical protein
MSGVADKRKKTVLSKVELDILKWLLIKTLVPIMVIILFSLIVLFFGLDFLVQKTSFGNYGLAPGIVKQNVSAFVSTYVFIALINILLMLSLCALILDTMLRNVVLPIMRIAREVKRMSENSAISTIVVRKSDKLLIPLVEGLNGLSRFVKF